MELRVVRRDVQLLVGERPGERSAGLEESRRPQIHSLHRARVDRMTSVDEQLAALMDGGEEARTSRRLEEHRCGSEV